ncbi:MAG: RDD family protein [Clostridia bacterium]|nr:RDD family protein [Clostridia bacterium]
MICDLQKASMWKRISAFLFDLILLSIAGVLSAWLLSAATGYDGYRKRLNNRYDHYGAEYGVDMHMSLNQYDSLTPEEQTLLETAYDALAADAEAVRAYSMTIQLTILITSLGLLAGYLITEFAVPLALKDGRTLGKRIFGLAVMRSDGVRISPVLLFVRTVLGKYALETMIPVFIVMMMFWGNLGIVGLAVLILIPVLEIIVMIRTPGNSMIHDLVSHTTVVDYASQMIFDSSEAMIAYKERIHAQEHARGPY